MNDNPRSNETTPRHDAYSALRLRDFRLFLSGAVLANVGMQMQTAAIGWEVYDRTRSAWALGWVGLAQVIPVIALVLPAGHVADRYDRRRVLMTTLLIVGLGSLGLTWVSWREASVLWVYALLFWIGTGRAFLQPARASLLPQIIPREQFPNAVTWNSGAFHLACVVGPSLAGFLIAAFHGATVVFLLDAMAVFTYFVLVGMVRHRSPAQAVEEVSFRSLAAGFGFLRRAPLVLGAISLDLFAVLLGGATTLLPIYAQDILHVGPTGYGWMRAAPAVGAICMALLLAYRPPLEKAGPTLLWAVGGFGIATIVFGFSHWYWLSLLMLFFTGFLDNISVVVRHTLVQLSTPDDMRGRVSAINSMFIGASNELGGFESGALAALVSPVFSVVFGGFGTLLVVGAIAVAFPQLRRYGRLGGAG